MPLNETQIRGECHTLKVKGITNVAVIGVFSPLDINGLQEARVRDIVQQEIPEADIVLSRDSKSPSAEAILRDSI
jgi:N-methylhydantoinase A/oxoprolinase/acetone carboxylase beta subunit